MRPITRMVIFMGALALAACASQGPATSTGAGASQQGSPATASAATNTGSTPAGYRRKVVDGQELFCRNDTDTGSRVSRTEVCLTKQQLQDQQQANQQQLQNLQGEGYNSH